MKQGKLSPFFSAIILRLYRLVKKESVRSRLRKWILKVEGGPAHSLTIRVIFGEFYNVEVGLHTFGVCETMPRVFHPGTTVGRYSVISDSVRTFTRNHPMNTKSTHGFFENPALGRVKTDLMQFGRLAIGNGVWIGCNAIILPPTKQIGDGAIVTAGSVVYSDVPPYAIVTGCPAQVTGYRLSAEGIAKLLASQWWEESPAELAAQTETFQRLQD